MTLYITKAFAKGSQSV